MLALWEQYREQLLKGLEIFEKIADAAERGIPDEDLRQKAAVEAHKLIGSFGILKLREGTRLAAALEDQFKNPAFPKTDPAALRTSVSTMRRLLADGPPRQNP